MRLVVRGLVLIAGLALITLAASYVTRSYRKPDSPIEQLAFAVPANVDMRNIDLNKIIHEGPYGIHRAFPDIRDWNSLRLSLTRTRCFGTCPAYSVEIRGDGSVRYQGEGCVAEKGAQTARLARVDIERLLTAFRRADFFSLRDYYMEGSVDDTAVVLSLRYDNHAKRVVDFAETDDMPRPAADLPALMDKIVNSARWVEDSRKACGSR